MENVKFEEWQKLDLRVGKIIKIENHPNADKLYVLEVDLGSMGKRTIVAGLRKYYQPEELLNQQCIIFANLEPAVLRGIKSEGMILASGSEDKKDVRILQPEKEIELGSKVS